MLTSGLPHFAKGLVIKGFGRGSKDLGIPTANFPPEVVDNLPAELKTGVYYGFANIDNGSVYKMVMSVGWNPYYKNEKKSMETHIMHDFGCDFYEKILKVCMLGYLRPEKNFNSLDELISAIRKDINDAEQYLEDPKLKKFEKDSYFSID